MSLAITLLPLCPAHIPLCFHLLSHAEQCLHPHFWLPSKCSRGRNCLVFSVTDKALLGSLQSGAAPIVQVYESGDGDKMYRKVVSEMVEAGRSKYIDRGT